MAESLSSDARGEECCVGVVTLRLVCEGLGTLPVPNPAHEGRGRDGGRGRERGRDCGPWPA